MVSDLDYFFRCEKSFPAVPAWAQRDGNNLALVSPLDIDGVTVEGLQFRATVLKHRPDENLTFQLEFFPPGRRPKGGPISRIEWRPLSGHNNKMIGPPDLYNVPQTGSHYHDFTPNWKYNKQLVRKGQLKIAVPINPESSLDEILAFVGKEFRISNINWMPVPPWEAVLC